MSAKAICMMRSKIPSISSRIQTTKKRKQNSQEAARCRGCAARGGRRGPASRSFSRRLAWRPRLGFREGSCLRGVSNSVPQSPILLLHTELPGPNLKKKERQKDRKTERQKDRKTERQKECSERERERSPRPLTGPRLDGPVPHMLTLLWRTGNSNHELLLP